MSVFVCHRHLLYNFLDVLVSNLHIAIHLRPVRVRIMMLDLELLTELGDHRVVEIHTIVSNNPLWDTISTDQICRMNCAMTFLVTVANEASLTHFVK